MRGDDVDDDVDACDGVEEVAVFSDEMDNASTAVVTASAIFQSIRFRVRCAR